MGGLARVISKLHEEMGFSNVIVMIPFCRTIGEADNVLAAMAQSLSCVRCPRMSC